MNFLSPQGQIITCFIFIKVLILITYVAFKIYFYQRWRATPLGEPLMTACEVVVWEEVNSTTGLIFCSWSVRARRKTTIFTYTWNFWSAWEE
jgi:hypothetical protein